MGISRFNGEGYPDPTAHEGVRLAEKDGRKWMPLVYICSPFAGNVDQNIRSARQYCRFAVDSGAIPLASHLLLPQFMSEETERDLALFMGMVLMDRCEEVWVFGNTVSTGMQKEIMRAERRGMPVRYFTEEGREKQWATDDGQN